jgi:hypothetical protein
MRQILSRAWLGSLSNSASASSKPQGVFKEAASTTVVVPRTTPHDLQQPEMVWVANNTFNRSGLSDFQFYDQDVN